MRNGNEVNYNYFSFGVGMFLKFFESRRPLKRTKLFKLLLVRFLRKVLILSTIPRVHLVINRSPTLFTELYKAFTTPDIVPFRTLNRRRWYNDSKINLKRVPFTVDKFAFFRTKFYGLFKERRRGRLKRKVARRLIKKNSVLD